MANHILDQQEKIRAIDKSNMLSYCTNMTQHYKKAAELAQKITINYPQPDSIIVAGMGGSGISGELLKDWARNKIAVPIEVNREYNLPKYANQKTLVLISSYSGDTEESLSSFIDALNRKCMIFCISSNGTLLKYAEKLKIPHLQVPDSIPPRAALPYLFIPLLVCLEKTGLASGVSEELSEALKILAKLSQELSPEKQVNDNFAKTLAQNIGESAPTIYGFGFYRSVAQRFKQQFNENSKVPSKWEYFPELNHNEIVGWENTGELSKNFSALFIRDRDEPKEIASRITTTMQIMQGIKTFEVHSQGNSPLAKMLSVVCIGDFTSVYLAVLHGVDPTPVKTINQLKDTLNKTGGREKIISRLERLVLG